MQTVPFDDLRRILVIRLDNLGDVIMTGPALRALRQANPAAHITLMASPAGSQAVPLLPWIDDVITWQAVWQDIGEQLPVEPEKEYELVQRLSRQNFDAAFIFTGFAQSPHPPAYACYLARIPIRVGQTREFGGGLLSHWVRPLPDQTYQVKRNLHLLQSVGIPAGDENLELRVPVRDQQRAADLLAACGITAGQPYLLLAPGASAASRRYDESRYAEVLRLITRQLSLPVVLVGSQQEAGRYPALERRAAVEALVHSLIGQTTVTELAALIRRAELVMCNNSSALHMAAAFQRPVVALFAGTEIPEQWVPTTAGTRVLNRPTACAPCYAFQCPYHLECLDFSPEEVAGAVIDQLHASAAATAAGQAYMNRGLYA